MKVEIYSDGDHSNRQIVWKTRMANVRTHAVQNVYIPFGQQVRPFKVREISVKSHFRKNLISGFCIIEMGWSTNATCHHSRNGCVEWRMFGEINR